MVEIKIEKSLLKVLGVVLVMAIAGIVWAKRPETPTPRVVTSTPVSAQSPAQSSAQSTPQTTTTASGSTKENSGGDVTVSITPVVENDAELGFDVAINTHTVDMSAFDPKKQIVIIGADGKDVSPSNVAIEGSGHHQKLQITFPKVEKPWKLAVRDVGGVPAREFNW